MPTQSTGQFEQVSYDDLFQVVKSGRNRDNVRKHVSTIREAFKEIDPDFDGIENVPMRGFRCQSTTFTTSTRTPLATLLIELRRSCDAMCWSCSGLMHHIV